MPKNLKIGLAVFVLIAGVAAAYFILQNSSSISSNVGSDVAVSKQEEQVAEFISEKPLDATSSEFFSGQNGKTGKNNYNITQSLAESVFNNINSSDIAGKIKNSISPSADSLPNLNMNDVLAKAQADLRLFSMDDIEDSQLKISADNSKEAKQKYLEDIAVVLKKDAGNFNKNYLQIIVDTYQKTNSSSAKQAADIYERLATDFTNISTPSDWRDVQKATVVYYKNSEVVYRAMADYQSDPIRGYAALEIVEQVVDEGLAVQQLLTGKVKLLSKQ